MSMKKTALSLILILLLAALCAQVGCAEAGPVKTYNSDNRLIQERSSPVRTATRAIP